MLTVNRYLREGGGWGSPKETIQYALSLAEL
jgi:hypothetical protein